MPTHTSIRAWLQHAWRDYRGVAAGSLAGFLLGLTLATQMPQIQGYLLRSVLEWREASLTSPETLRPAAPEEPVLTPPDVPDVLPPSEELPRRAETRRPTPQRAIPARPAPSPASEDVLTEPSRNMPPVERAPEVQPSPVPVPRPGPVPLPAPEPAPDAFPAFIKSSFPVPRVPHWGAMHSAAQWNRSYKEMTPEDFVAIPGYDMGKLTVPFQTLLEPRNDGEITRKLFYSTHYFGAYDVDAGEFTAAHPGIDLKLALGTPLGAIGGGRVHRVASGGPLGLHVIIEHRIGEKTYYSIYGHLGSAGVREGQAVTPGQYIGNVGLTGNTSAAHLHLQVDIGHGEAVHEPYMPKSTPSPGEAALWVISPIRFMQQYRTGSSL